MQLNGAFIMKKYQLSDIIILSAACEFVFAAEPSVRTISVKGSENG